MPRIAVVLEVLIMAMMLSLSLMDITRHAYRRAASKATVACTIWGHRSRRHGLRVVELKNVWDGVRYRWPFHWFT
jgi:hypothetical protein